MIYPKAIDKLGISEGARPEPTPRTFVRAAGLANLLVATLICVESCGMALIEHEPTAFVIGLLLVPSVSLAIWVIAVVLYVLALGPRALRALGRCLASRPRSLPAAGSGVWDEWLDRALPLDR